MNRFIFLTDIISHTKIRQILSQTNVASFPAYFKMILEPPVTFVSTCGELMQFKTDQDDLGSSYINFSTGSRLIIIHTIEEIGHIIHLA